MIEDDEVVFLDLDAEISKSPQKKAEEIVAMRMRFPNLKIFRDHYGTMKYCSDWANPRADLLELDSCHTCEGKPLKAWPHLMVEDIKLYADPPYVVIADQNQAGFGEVPRADWQESFLDLKIDKDLIRKVGGHLRAHPPIDYFED